MTTEATTEQLLVDAGESASAPYRQTPLDFFAKEMFTGSHIMTFFGMRCDNPECPTRVFPNDRFPDISTWQKFALFRMSSAYAASHLMAWNFTFPTPTERLL
jgi:hypothetical protein